LFLKGIVICQGICRALGSNFMRGLAGFGFHQVFGRLLPWASVTNIVCQAFVKVTTPRSKAFVSEFVEPMVPGIDSMPIFWAVLTAGIVIEVSRFRIGGHFIRFDVQDFRSG